MAFIGKASTAARVQPGFPVGFSRSQVGWIDRAAARTMGIMGVAFG
jgi:hypothetical protein